MKRFIRKYPMKNKKIKQFDLKAISHWFATGFFENYDKSFLYDDKYKNQYGPKIKWFYEPRNISFKTALNEFGDLFESIIRKKTNNKKIVLPLSGGLDSRTLAAALKDKKNISTYSYEFDCGVSEIKYAENIAKVQNWEFHKFKIKKGYLWEKIEELATINNCRTEFTHPRQMAVMGKISNLGDVLLSGSMGDLLFDSYSLSNKLTKNDLKFLLKKMILKTSGLEFSIDFWSYWKLDGNFNLYLDEILNIYLAKINIEENSNKAKAFKIDYYVKNWTNNNLNIFNFYIPTFAPYHSNKLSEFICSLPEEYLKDRKIQIAYIKKKAPLLARIPWQAYDLDLYNFHRFNTVYFPRRLFRYVKRNIGYKIFKNRKPVTRNWELQFIDKENKKHLEGWLYDNKKLNKIVPKGLILEYYEKFKNNNFKYSHLISMLLTLSVWSKKNV